LFHQFESRTSQVSPGAVRWAGFKATRVPPRGYLFENRSLLEAWFTCEWVPVQDHHPVECAKLSPTATPAYRFDIRAREGDFPTRRGGYQGARPKPAKKSATADPIAGGGSGFQLLAPAKNMWPRHVFDTLDLQCGDRSA